MTNKIEKSLYNGEIKIIFYPDSHRYKIEGQKGWLVGVTTALNKLDKSNALIYWSTGLARDFLNEKILNGDSITIQDVNEACALHKIRKEEAADIGSQIHDWIDQFVKCETQKQRIDLEIPEDEKVQNGIMAFLDWKSKNKVEFIEHEKMVYSKKYNYVGTFDALAKVGDEGKIYLIDYKSSKGIYSTMRYQTAAYCQAYNEENKTDYRNRMILKLGKDDGEFQAEIFDKNDYDMDLEAFLSLLSIHNIEKKLSGWQACVNPKKV